MTVKPVIHMAKTPILRSSEIITNFMNLYKRLSPVTAQLIFLSYFLVIPIIFVDAHRPILTEKQPDTLESSLLIEDPTVSQVVYREVIPENGGQTWLRFEGVAGEKITIGCGVPVILRLLGYSQHLAVVGFGLPEKPSGLSLPKGLGAVVYPPSKSPRYFHEPFTGTNSWILVDDIFTVPANGTYYLVLYSPTVVEKGKIWITIGKKEQFGLEDLFVFSEWKRKVRAFHEVL